MGRGLDGYFCDTRDVALCSFEGPPEGVSRRFPVAMARGKHLFPFRTEQLSPSAPMVLGPQGPGRVGRRRFLHARAAPRAARRRCGTIAPQMGTVAGMPRLRVAVDVGGTFTDVFVLDEDSGGVHVAKVPSTPVGPDGGGDGRRRGGRRGALRRLAVLPRHHGRHQRADHPAVRGRRDGDDAQLPRRAGDPPRHQGRPVGRVQGRHAAVHPPPGPVRGDRAHRLRRRRDDAAGRGRGAGARRAAQAARGEDGRGLLRELLRRTR